MPHRFVQTMESDRALYTRTTQTDDTSPCSQLPYPLDTFDNYLVDMYTMPDPALETFFDISYFDSAISPTDYPGVLDTRLYPFGIRSAQSFEQLEQTFGSDFSDLESPLSPTIPTISPRRSSECSIDPDTTLRSEDTFAPVSPPLSQCLPNLKREAPSDSTTPDGEPIPKYVQRKRGRPRLDRKLPGARSTSPLSSSSLKNQSQAIRQSHTQVERKYREGLNSDLERLRRAVPTLTQSSDCTSIGQPKPSKAMVLSGAIDYIHDIEREVKELREEVGVLGGSVKRKAGGKGASKSKSKKQGSVMNFSDNEYKPNTVF